MKKQLIWVFEWRKSVHYCWSHILFSPECKELTSMLDPLLYRWGVPPVVIRCVHWTMQMGVLQTWIPALGLAIVMRLPETSGTLWIHRGALTNQRCSLATGCGITSIIPHPVASEHRWLVKAPRWIHSVPDVSSRRSWRSGCHARLWNLHDVTNASRL